MGSSSLSSSNGWTVVPLVGHHEQTMYNLVNNVSAGWDDGTFWESPYILLSFGTSPEEATKGSWWYKESVSKSEAYMGSA